MTQELATELDQLIRKVKPALESLAPGPFAHKPLPNKWSKKENMGPMIDRVQSKIRRFVVAQYEDTPQITYNQDKWVVANGYQQWEEIELISLWYLLNRQICQLFRNMPEAAAKRTCQTESLHTIEWLAEDYLKHMRHHLHQVLDWEPYPYA